MKAIHLKTEHMRNPIGLMNRQPYLSWVCEGDQSQTAWELEACIGGQPLWTSGRISGSETHCIFPKELPSRACVTWKVRLWNEQDVPGPWSEEATFELGITDHSEWRAMWILPAESIQVKDLTDAINRKAHEAWEQGKKKTPYQPHEPARYFRKIFRADAPVHARLYITARGVYAAYLNGERVGDYLLAPGPGVYDKHMPCQTYDVSGLLKSGDNELTVIVGDGWYRSCSGVNGDRDLFGTETALLCQMMEGDRVLCRTDDTWEAATDGPIRQNDLQQGEVFDARIDVPMNWRPVREETADYGRLSGDQSLPIAAQERFEGKIIRTPDGSSVVDFGQNLAGGIEITVRGHAGQRIFLMCGETLDEHGNFTQENFQNRKRHSENGTHQMVEYICREGLNHYETSFTIMGFRYARLETDVDLKDLNLRAFAIYSKMDLTGSWQCENAEVNQLVRNSLWSMKGNFCGVPTDCPTRERAGWTGDASVFSESGLYLMDCYPVYAKWLADCRDMQYEDGRVANIAPLINRPGFMTGRLAGSTGWGDACILVPWALYQRTGDFRILWDNYDMMRRWYAFLEKRARKRTLRKLLKPNKYSRYLIQSGIDYGEWCEPNVNNLREMMNPKKSSSTAYLAFSGSILAKIAALLGHPEEAAHYAEVSQGAKNAYLRAYTENGVIHSERQCEYVRALRFDLLPEDRRGQAAEMLNQLIVKNGYHLNTGFLSTPFLLEILMRYGYQDTAEKVLLQDTCPGWLYEVRKGATTLWENWDGISEDGCVKASLNHYSYGAVTGSLFAQAAGIRVSREGIDIDPYVLKGLGNIRCVYESPVGRIACGWEITPEGKTCYDLEIPANTEARFWQNGSPRPLSPGRHQMII